MVCKRGNSSRMIPANKTWMAYFATSNIVIDSGKSSVNAKIIRWKIKDIHMIWKYHLIYYFVIGRIGSFTVSWSDRHYFNQMIKCSISNWHRHWMWCLQYQPYNNLARPPKCNLRLIMRKLSDKSRTRNSLIRQPIWTLQKCKCYSKQKSGRGNCRDVEEL